MTRIIASLEEVSEAYDALFCDLWGCLHNGNRPYPAAVAALQQFRAKGGTVVLLTNAPRPKTSVKQQLERMGVPADAWDLIVTSGEAAQEGMLAGLVGHRVWHVGAPKDEGFFTDLPENGSGGAQITRVPLEDANGIVCTGLFDDLTEEPGDYRARFLLAKARGLKLLCANPDIVVDYGDRRLWCAGALAAMYTEMGGESLYFGKPHAPIYELARRRLGQAGRPADDARILAIGDGFETDIRGGVGEGIDTLFVTGGLEAERFGPDAENPDPARLGDWLSGKPLDPTFAIGRLR
jgi:HAD superfamily hydrolase (TIGR01459 family)